MSWAEEDWTVGLSGRVLQKVKELKIQQDRLSREIKQKQLLLDNFSASLEKQAVKHEEVRGELQLVQRELQMVRDEAKAVVISKERLTKEFQTKTAHVCAIEGQLDAARTLNNKLNQEIKWLEAKLEELQNSTRSADTTKFSTPCWNTTSPWEHNGSKREERGYGDEEHGRLLKSRQRLQFSDVARDSLPGLQQKNTPLRHPSIQTDSFSTPPSVFPWERDCRRPTNRRQSTPSPQKPCADVISPVQLDLRCSQKERDCRTDTDMSLSALQNQMSVLEEELSIKKGMLKSIQMEMVQIKKEFNARELGVKKAHSDLSLAHTRLTQESERASGAEQRLKQLQEDLRCQKQNADSSRLQYQQRAKEMEKQHQRDLTECQKERQLVEKQYQLEMKKLNQDLQQARTLNNALQSEAEKLSLQKHQLDKVYDSLKEKLNWTEEQLQEKQKKEAQMQAKLTEAVCVAASLDQSRKKESALEEESLRQADERAGALCRVKEMQEHVTPAILVQPVPIRPGGMNFSTQPSSSFSSRLSTHIRSSATKLTEQRREGSIDKSRVEITSMEREPGEGIESEQISVLISPDSESLRRRGNRTNVNDMEIKSKNDVKERDSAGPNKYSTLDDDSRNLILSAEKASSLKSKQTKASEDLKKENATLRSDLHDIREELQKRLDDLESQRRAEAEARTRLKQLSRKHANQSVEKKEQDKKWREQLEKEHAETERLRKAIVALETEINSGKETIEKNKREEEKNKDQENEMKELNIQLKKQLEETKAQLVLEQVERKRMEEIKNQITTTANLFQGQEMLTAPERPPYMSSDLEDIRQSNLLGSYFSEGRKVLSDIQKDEPCSLDLAKEVKRLQEENAKERQRANQYHVKLEALQSQVTCQTQQLTTGFENQSQHIRASTSEPEPKRLPYLASDLEDIRQSIRVELYHSENRESLSDIHKDESLALDLAEEVKHLQEENARETERAYQNQVKLEALQSQVTRQTQQLTTAFENQSQHISDLLAELQGKESALLCQGEELHHYKQKLAALEDRIEAEEKKRREELTVKELEDREDKKYAGNVRSLELSWLQPIQEREGSVLFPNTSSASGVDSNRQRETGQSDIVFSDPERPTLITEHETTQSGEQHPGSTTDVVVELLALQKENQLLKQRIFFSSIANTISHSSDGYPVQQSQKTENAVLPCSAEQQTQDEQLEAEERRIEGEREAEYQLQINHLQQQVEELHTEIQALSEETKQQAEELAVWRLASQPAPTFDIVDGDNQSLTPTQLSTIGQSQSNQQQTCEMSETLPGTQSQALTVKAQFQVPYLGIQESPGSVTVIREDELLFSCTCNKLQGHVLFSRLQCGDLPDSTNPFKEHQNNPANFEKDSEKGNLDIPHQSTSSQSQHNDQSDTEVAQMSSDKMCQQQETKNLHYISGTLRTKTAEHPARSSEADSDVSRETEMHISKNFSDSDVRREVKSVSMQTEESFHHCDAPKVSVQLHCAYTQTEEVVQSNEEQSVSSLPVSSGPLSKEAEGGDKRPFSITFPIQPDLDMLVERIRNSRRQLSSAFDNRDYRPYGLPEDVQKGFADIPPGTSSGSIVTRGCLGTTVTPGPKENQEEESREDETD